MAAPSPSARPQRRLVWLLWIALLLPITQAAAAWHAQSHTAEEVSHSADAHDKRAPQPERCDLCMTAAGLHGGALPSALPVVPRTSMRHEAPRAAFVGTWQEWLARAYESRAPPASSH